MKNAVKKIQTTSADQAEMLLNLLRLSFEGNQEMLEFNATIAKRNLNLIAKHSKALIANQQLVQNPVWYTELAQDTNQACSDYLLGSGALIKAMQKQMNELIQAQAQQFGEALGESVAKIQPAPVGQEIIDLTVRSWTGATKTGFEQTQEWQKRLEMTSKTGSRLLAALAAQAGSTKSRGAAVAA